MKTLTEVLERKGRQVVSIGPEATVYEAIETMAVNSIGALLVLDNGRLCGILSERDYARKVVLQGLSSRSTAVKDIMAQPVICARPDQSVEAAMAIMTERRIRHLPVTDETKKIVGVVSIGDLIKAIIDEQQFLIDQLEYYIHG